MPARGGATTRRGRPAGQRRHRGVHHPPPQRPRARPVGSHLHLVGRGADAAVPGLRAARPRPDGPSTSTRRSARTFGFARKDSSTNRATATESTVREIGPSVVYDSGGVRVTAFLVNHGEWREAYGYRFDSHGRSIVLSGDTRPSEELVRMATGVDVLIHEAVPSDSTQHPGRRSARSGPSMSVHITRPRCSWASWRRGHGPSSSSSITTAGGSRTTGSSPTSGDRSRDP